MTDEQIKEIEDRHKAASSGDWTAMPAEDGGVMEGYISAGKSPEGYSLDVIISEFDNQANIDFILAAHKYIPALIKAIKGYKATLKDLGW